MVIRVLLVMCWYKIESIEIKLKKWNEEVFGNVAKRKKELVDGLCELDMIAKERHLNEDEGLRKEDISREL
jgi:hypothetical protein